MENTGFKFESRIFYFIHLETVLNLFDDFVKR